MYHVFHSSVLRIGSMVVRMSRNGHSREVCWEWKLPQYFLEQLLAPVKFKLLRPQAF